MIYIVDLSSFIKYISKDYFLFQLAKIWSRIEGQIEKPEKLSFDVTSKRKVTISINKYIHIRIKKQYTKIHEINKQ